MLVLAVPAPAQQAAPSGVAAEWERAVGLVQSGAPEQAIPILERLVTALPDAAPVRLELGLAYFLTRDDGKARHHITGALAGELGETERAGAERLLREIAARRRWSAGFSVSLVPQSNAGRRTSDAFITLPGLPFPFILNQTAESGTGLAFAGRFGFSPILGTPAEGRTLRGQFALALQGTVYEESSLNDITLRGEAGLVREQNGRAGGLPHSFGGGLVAAQRWVGGTRYTHEAGVWTTVSLQPADTLRLSGRFEAVERRAPGRPGLDARILRLTLGADRVLTPRLAVHGRGFITVTDARAAHEGGRLVGLTLGVRHLFDGGWLGSLEATVSRDRRDGMQPLFLVSRRDTDLRLAARLLNRQLQMAGFAPVLEIGHERRRSNVPIAAFRNSYVSVGLDRAF